MDKDCADELALFANTHTPADSLLYSLEQAAKGIGLCLNSDKTEFMRFEQNDDISTLNGEASKLVEQFTYIGSNISSTEIDVKICIEKAWTAFDHMEIWCLWKNKTEFFQDVAVSVLLYSCTSWNLTKHIDKNLHMGTLQGCSVFFEKILKADSQKTGPMRTIISNLPNHPNKINWVTISEARMNREVTSSCELLHINTYVDQPAKNYIHRLCVQSKWYIYIYIL